MADAFAAAAAVLMLCFLLFTDGSCGVRVEDPDGRVQTYKIRSLQFGVRK